MNQITVTELAAAPGATVIDVREPFEFVSGHVPQAVNIPLGSLIERIGELPADETLYIICEAGGRSAQAAQYLGGLDYDAVNVVGGTGAWRAAQLPVSTEA
ncbi:rhodanese-like domain-containing protein [Galbitalea soli]|uniref:Rhodanese-like domain-containing protein n=1 Tax=Galbitalea soli TaxID=1268042 RepID=A0A7C9TTE0_9MICO|nr:rhodanese-like domain-containing protein [Galbitalea soli]NEM92420.1 rhodanese-like domain-containing protein [Galbitalea soli]NYJ29454.1 rhodanese-related sulfurtransferase [Galbitalea soli]